MCMCVAKDDLRRVLLLKRYSAWRALLLGPLIMFNCDICNGFLLTVRRPPFERIRGLQITKTTAVMYLRRRLE